MKMSLLNCHLHFKKKEVEGAVKQLLVMRSSVYASNQAYVVSVLNLDGLISHHWSDDPCKITQIATLQGRKFFNIVKSPEPS